MHGLTHAVAARLSQLDYDRELALIAFGGQMPLGVVHYFADPDHGRAEYAIAVRRAWKGKRARLFVDAPADRGRPVSAASASWQGKCCGRTSRCCACAANLAS